MERWNPPVELSRKETWIMKRLKRTRKLFAFLRLHRHEIFDETFQDELAGMYRQTGAGECPKPPALLAMVVLLQAYMGISDAEAVELSMMDIRWQLVLGCLGAEEPAFSQGGLQQFRERLIQNDMDRRLLERTVELARRTKIFDWRKLPKKLEVAFDSRPLQGAGRVEDTFNLLAHAGRKIAAAAAEVLQTHYEEVCDMAGAPLLAGSSIKAGLDIDWRNRKEKDGALGQLIKQLSALHQWVDETFTKQLADEEIRSHVKTLEQIAAQDLEQVEGGAVQIRQGVAEDRRVSIEDPEMRHGRKSKSNRFNGYKEHVATDINTDLILSCALTPANRPEEAAGEVMQADIERQQAAIDRLFIDLGYRNSPVVDNVLDAGGEVICKPWATPNRGDLFNKTDFKLNMRDQTITCPAGETEWFELGQVVYFDPDICGACPLRASCTKASSGKGRTVSIAEDEKLEQRFRKALQTAEGREEHRRRTHVEHRLAHIAKRKGRRARYRGVRKNLFDLRRAAAVQNLETIDRKKRKYASKTANVQYASVWI